LSRKRAFAAAVVAIGLVAAACAGDTDTPGQVTGTGSPAASAAAGGDALRLGYFPNLTHATAIVGVEKGFIAKHLAETGGSTKLETKTFNAGGDAVTALFGNSIDASYIGPNPAINAFQKSDGEAIRIISGATSGGAYLVTKKDINSTGDLEGKKIATPQLGNTQDVALRAWLKEEGLETTTSGGGDVEIVNQENAVSLETFRSGDIDGAWVPEPWATRLVDEGGGKVLLDEAELWPNGRYVTTHLIVRTEYLAEHPDQVKALLEGHLEADGFIHENSDEAKTVVNDGIEKVTTKAIAIEVLDKAWENLTFTVDPVASSLEKSKNDAVELGLLEAIDLEGIYDLAPLNALLKADGREEVDGL
jgi:NitT/TauT family transport system substrate-binding protein